MEHAPVTIPFLAEFMTLLAAAGILVPLFQRLSISPVLAYLFAGLLIGPYGLGLLVPEGHWLGGLVIRNGHEVQILAELGVIFLLFVIGLELSPARLWALRRYVLGLGSLQFGLTSVVIGCVAFGFGNSLPASLLLGAALALSSTAIVMQLLAEQHATGQPVGRTSFSILLLQDLAVVPILVLAGVLADGGSVWLALGSAALKAAAAIALIVAVGLVVLRPLFRLAARAVGDEAFLALALLVAVGTSALTGAAGLSMALGAFLAGMLLAETEYSHAIETYIAPFKSLLLGIFFMSVGMGFNVLEVMDHLFWLSLSLVGMIAIKAMIIAILSRSFGLSWRVAIETGFLLGQAGEFAFIVIGLAMSTNLLSADTGQFMLILTGLSMLVSPAAAAFGRRAGRFFDYETPHSPAPVPSATDYEGHILIAGYGRVGRVISEVLEAEGIPWVAIDNDAIAVAAARKHGRNVWFGDACQKPMLERLGMARARGAVVTTNTPSTSEEIMNLIHDGWPMLPLCVRTRDRSHARRLMKTDGVQVVPENLELALQMSALVLRSLQLDEDAILQRLQLTRLAALGI